MSKPGNFVFAVSMLFAPFAGSAAGNDWDVQPDFKNDEAAFEISGAVCAGDDGKAEWCFAVNDEKKYIQVFSIDGQTLVPGSRLRVLAKEDANRQDNGEADIETIAYHAGFIYLAGSHGLSRKRGVLEPSRFLVYRFPVKRMSGEPEFVIDRNMVATEIEQSAKLRAIIGAADGLEKFAEKPLSENGANIEGLGVSEDGIYFGFRAPITSRGAVILQVAEDQLFANEEYAPKAHFLDLGSGYGIRDMARLADRFLVLSGASGSEDLAPAIWSWSPGQSPQFLSELDVPPEHKAEALMVLDGSADDSMRVLVLFDGQENGAPTEYVIPIK